MPESAPEVRSISRIKSSSRHEVTIPNLVFRCSEFGGVTDCLGLTDASFVQARAAKEIQEISWEIFPLSVDTVDKEREKHLRKKEKKAAGDPKDLILVDEFEAVGAAPEVEKSKEAVKQWDIIGVV
ncbi:hypothetical protein Tco_0252139 [Tanacetum coccineum]